MEQGSQGKLKNIKPVLSIFQEGKFSGKTMFEALDAIIPPTRPDDKVILVYC